MFEADYAEVLRLLRQRLREHGLADMDARIMSSRIAQNAVKGDLGVEEQLLEYLALLVSEIERRPEEITPEIVDQLSKVGHGGELIDELHRHQRLLSDRQGDD